MQLAADAQSGNFRTSSLHYLLLFGVFFLGVCLRFANLDFGLPYVSNFYIRPDETILIFPALEIRQRWGDPQFHFYPALSIYLQAIAFHLLYFCRVISGSAANNLIADFFAAQAEYWTAARSISAAAGSAQLYFVYRISRHMTGADAALWATALFSVAPLPVREAHFAVTDTLLATLSLAAIWCLIRFSAVGTIGAAAKAGAVLGLALATKYSALLLLPAAVVFVAVSARKSKAHRATAAITYAAACGAVFCLLNPYLLVRADELFQFARSLAAAHQGAEQSHTLIHWASLSPFRFGAGGIAGAALIPLAVSWTLFSRTFQQSRGSALLVLSSALSYALPLVFSDHVPFRYLLPVIALAAPLLAIGVHVLTSRAHRQLQWAIAALLTLAAFGSAQVSLALGYGLGMEDTRSLAGRWIAAHVSSSMPIVLVTPPEAEPQIDESPQSLTARMDYAVRLYGPAGAQNILAMYRLLLVQAEIANATGTKAPQSAIAVPGSGFTVFRNPSAEGVPPRALIVVSGGPHPLARSALSPTARLSLANGFIAPVLPRHFVMSEHCFFAGVGHQTQKGLFDSVLTEWLFASRGDLDPIDAFFLPLGNASPYRPGTDLCLYQTEER